MALFNSLHGKRCDSEVEKLFLILEGITDVKDTHIQRIHLAADAHIPSLNANLEVALSMCDKILEKEKQHLNAELTAKRELRKLEWENFIEDMTKKCVCVDKTFEEKKDELKEFYTDLERKLHLND